MALPKTFFLCYAEWDWSLLQGSRYVDYTNQFTNLSSPNIYLANKYVYFDKNFVSKHF